MFHVSFLCFNLLIINVFKRWNIQFQCFIFSFNVSLQKNTVGAIQKHCGRDLKTLWERFKNTVGEIQKHWGRDSKTLRERFKNTEEAMKRSLSVLKNETWNLKWNMKLKMKHWIRMFHFLNTLIINKLKHKNETWKINQRFWKRIEISCNLST